MSSILGLFVSVWFQSKGQVWANLEFFLVTQSWTSIHTLTDYIYTLQSLVCIANLSLGAVCEVLYHVWPSALRNWTICYLSVFTRMCLQTHTCLTTPYMHHALCCPFILCWLSHESSKRSFRFPINYANSDCNFLKWIAHKPCERLHFPKDHMSNILRPRVRSSTGCLLRVHSSCCVQDGVLDPGDIRRAGRWCVDGGRSRSRVRRYTLVLLQVSHPGHRKTGPLIGGS